MIGILDYGLGNIQAFVNVYKRLGINTRVVRLPTELSHISRLILPGVGAFDHAMTLFNKSGLRSPVEELVTHKHLPLLGICVGMQMLAESSEEGKMPGLGLIKGKVLSLSNLCSIDLFRLPHMGWNNVSFLGSSILSDGLDNEPQFYFLHSFYFAAQCQNDVIASVDYGGRFACAVARSNVMGVQFHPEKSHRSGTQLLKNFSEI